MSRLLLGGSGRLGRELLTAFAARGEQCVAPSRLEADLLRPASIAAAIARHRPAIVIHAAALVGARPCQDDPARAWAVNAAGSLTVARAAAAAGCKLVYLSTDSVFDGEKGMYHEADLPAPLNTYSLTKLMGEAYSAMVPRHLIVRTSFIPKDRFPYPVAFTDQWTSRTTADRIAEELALAIALDVHGVLHIAGERDVLYNIARRISPEVGATTRAETGLRLPRDLSLDCSRWHSIKAGA